MQRTSKKSEIFGMFAESGGGELGAGYRGLASSPSTRLSASDVRFSTHIMRVVHAMRFRMQPRKSEQLNSDKGMGIAQSGVEYGSGVNICNYFTPLDLDGVSHVWCCTKNPHPHSSIANSVRTPFTFLEECHPTFP